MDSQIDESENFEYEDVKVQHNGEDIYGIEYICNDNLFGIKPKGIKQFASSSEDLRKKINDMYKYVSILQNFDVKNYISFTKEEEETLRDNYMNIIYSGIPQSNYKNEKGVTITVDKNEIITNVYYATITKEQLNNIYIAMLQQLKEDNIILDKLINIRKSNNAELTDSEIQKIRIELISKIESKIKEIEINNIGEQERTISIYESNNQPIRMEIKTDEYTIIIDEIKDVNSRAIEMKKVYNNDDSNSQKIRIQKTIQEKQEKYSLILQEINNGQEENTEFEIERRADEVNNMLNTINLKRYNEDNEIVINIKEDISIVNNFSNKIQLNEENNIIIENIEEQQRNSVMQIIQDDLAEQIGKVTEIINQSDIQSILVNLNLKKPDQEEIVGENAITEAERNRFNAQFEICIGENIGYEQVNRLIEVSKQHLVSVKITQYKDKEQQEDSLEPKQYKLIIKKDNQNEELANSLSKYIKESGDDKFSVNAEYNKQNGLIENIFITVQEE